MCPLVTTIVEDAILQYIRPEDPDFYSKTATISSESQQNPDFYVDAHGLSYILGNLVNYLAMDRTGYTFFILNPKSPFLSGDSLYGYREGFSTSEIQQLHRNDTIEGFLSTVPPINSRRETKNKPATATTKINGASEGAFATGGRRTVKISDFTEKSFVWAQEWLERPKGCLLVNPTCPHNPESSSDNVCQKTYVII